MDNLDVVEVFDCSVDGSKAVETADVLPEDCVVLETETNVKELDAGVREVLEDSERGDGGVERGVKVETLRDVERADWETNDEIGDEALEDV